MKRLAGKVALITGSSRGIGRAMALAMAGEGADIVVNYRTHPKEAHDVAQSIANLGQNALLVQADVAERQAVQRMFDEAVERFGHVDIAVANASHSVLAPVVEANWEDVSRTFEVAQCGVFHTCQFAAQRMVKQTESGRRGGKIIIIGSVHAELNMPNSAPYAMAKAAINHLGRTLAVELAPYHINVNTINPGWIDTPGERDRFGDARIDGGGNSVPWGRLGLPAEIAGMAVYLASADSDYVTGATLRVDGGYVLGPRIPEV
jgi:glucose 1-dehydrogenase